MSDARLTVLDQLDQLEEIVLEGSRVPFTGGRLVNEGEAVDVLDAVREVLPKELERAEQLLLKRDEFINTARQQAEDDENVTVEEIEYRYPGPKPHTKEAAILMLSDCVESAARAMTERKPSQIEQLVRDLALKRLMDGQFDECNLTFNELAQIQAAIVSRVNAIYHGRVSYPDEDEQPEPVASTA